jgi:endonuclease-3
MSRLEDLIARLKRFYGALPSPPRDPFTLFVWEVLGAHSDPRKRDAALGALKRIRALTPDAMWRAPQKKLLDSVTLAGPYAENRLRALRTGVDLFRRSPQLPSVIKGPMAAALKALKPLPQMGEGGAYRMLVFAASQPVLPVDARLSRVARRLGFGEANADFKRTARSIRAAVAGQLEPSVDVYRSAYIYLSHHGAVTCSEASPHCAVCPLLEDCTEGQNRAANGS